LQLQADPLWLTKTTLRNLWAAKEIFPSHLTYPLSNSCTITSSYPQRPQVAAWKNPHSPIYTCPLHDKLPGIFFQIFSWWRLKSGRKQDPQLLKFSWQPGVIISGWSWSSISPCSVVGRNFRSFKGLRKSASRRSLKSHACAI
jgi:hypothetical protein